MLFLICVNVDVRLLRPKYCPFLQNLLIGLLISFPSATVSIFFSLFRHTRYINKSLFKQFPISSCIMLSKIGINGYKIRILYVSEYNLLFSDSCEFSFYLLSRPRGYLLHKKERCAVTLFNVLNYFG